MVPTYRLVSPDEAYAAVVDDARGLPAPLRPIVRPILRRLGFDLAGTEEARRAHAVSLLLVAFWPRTGAAERG